jgi:hypothetical protein
MSRDTVAKTYEMSRRLYATQNRIQSFRVKSASS